MKWSRANEFARRAQQKNLRRAIFCTAPLARYQRGKPILIRGLIS
jgi:hypothetical protein